jgi:hypothetical protein
MVPRRSKRRASIRKKVRASCILRQLRAKRSSAQASTALIYVGWSTTKTEEQQRRRNKKPMTIQHSSLPFKARTALSRSRRGVMTQRRKILRMRLREVRAPLLMRRHFQGIQRPRIKRRSRLMTIIDASNVDRRIYASVIIISCSQIIL